MSQVYALGAKVMCNNIAGLVTYQRQLCQENPDVMVSIGKGAKLGVVECQQQFKDQRWNCSTVARDVSVFGKVMRRGKSSSVKKVRLLLNFYGFKIITEIFLLIINSRVIRWQLMIEKVKRNILQLIKTVWYLDTTPFQELLNVLTLYQTICNLTAQRQPLCRW